VAAKILIDSSAWIHFFNQSSAAHSTLVASAIREDRATICGPILTEVLRGCRTGKEQATVASAFHLLECFPILRADFVAAGALGRKLAAHGFTVKTIDLIIAYVAIRERVILLQDDADYRDIAAHSRLKLVRV
jgi:predicted nucleic acid-binding protein